MATSPSLLPDTSIFTKPQSLTGIMDLLRLLNVGQQDQANQKLQTVQTAQATQSGQSAQAGNDSGGQPSSAPTSRGMASAKGASPYDDFYAAAEDRYGLPADTLKTTGFIESRHNPKARNELSQYRGLMQLGYAEEKNYGANAYDPASSIDAAARIAVRNRDHFRNVVGRDPSAGEIYLMHQQGIAGGPALIKNPDMPAYRALMTVGVPEGAAIRHIAANGGNPNAPASQFVQKWTGYFDNSAVPRNQKVASNAGDVGDRAGGMRSKSDDVFDEYEKKAVEPTKSSSKSDSVFEEYEPKKGATTVAGGNATPTEGTFADRFAAVEPSAQVNQSLRGIGVKPEKVLGGGTTSDQKLTDALLSQRGLGQRASDVKDILKNAGRAAAQPMDSPVARMLAPAANIQRHYGTAGMLAAEAPVAAALSNPVTAWLLRRFGPAALHAGATTAGIGGAASVAHLLGLDKPVLDFLAKQAEH